MTKKALRVVTGAPLYYDKSLLMAERYTFSVLRRILDAPCDKIITDDHDFILCRSEKPFPVWVWTRDGALEETLEAVYRITVEQWPGSEYRYNMKYETASYFIARGHSLELNMMTYDCPAPIAPEDRISGAPRLAVMEDLNVLTGYMTAFHDEIAQDRRSAEETRRSTAEKIGSGQLHIWEDAGRIVCVCGHHTAMADGLCSVGPVYTPPEARRRHYAQHLVYYVTRLIVDRGLMPVLYTDADYAPSNSCYKKIGYELKGTLCTIRAGTAETSRGSM
ncbi:MAG: GNAT family N-acetyltransferase [Clostridia bacterium]|nr:GNAT family N-acetyltransferase [Clostridia bacterium]